MVFTTELVWGKRFFIRNLWFCVPKPVCATEVLGTKMWKSARSKIFTTMAFSQPATIFGKKKSDESEISSGSIVSARCLAAIRFKTSDVPNVFAQVFPTCPGSFCAVLKIRRRRSFHPIARKSAKKTSIS